MLICQLTDLHVRPVGKTADRVSETNMFTERAFAAFPAQPSPRRGPDHRRPDRMRSGRGIRAAEAAPAQVLPIPVFVIPGNHDRRENLREALKHLPVSPPTRTTAVCRGRLSRSGWSCWIRWCRAPVMGS